MCNGRLENVSFELPTLRWFCLLRNEDEEEEAPSSWQGMSEFALASGIILEGNLQKKSKTWGFWQPVSFFPPFMLQVHHIYYLCFCVNVVSDILCCKNHLNVFVSCMFIILAVNLLGAKCHYLGNVLFL